jgi:hypothetical protein
MPPKRSTAAAFAALLASGGCAAPAPAPEATVVAVSPAPAAQAMEAPTGARIEASGFATVEQAPPRPYADAPPPAEDRPETENGWYAREAGITEAEAAKRRAEQQAAQPEMARLIGTLNAREAGNFTATRMIHKPDWAYVFYFKRDPERTLARYTSNPHFRAALARYSKAELEALSKPWLERFERHRLTGGWGLDETYGTVEIMMGVTEEEYRAVAAREGWGALPDALELRFSRPLSSPPVSADAQPFVRLMPQDDRSTVIQLTAGASGRILIRDGCLMVGGSGGAPRLAYFHRETGIGRDAEGYLVLVDRATGAVRGRIGEWFIWAAPNHYDETMPMAAELRARCGTAPVLNVGNPESGHSFRARASAVDELARRTRISRQQAWERLKRCWSRNDASAPDRPPSGNCR